MLYRYNKSQIKFDKINSIKLFFYLLLFITLMSLLFWIYGYATGFKAANEKIKLSDYEKLILINEADEFTEDKFIDMLKELNINYPYIAFAQSMIETGSWTSKIFIENHNLFGMKEAKQRVTTAGGTQYNHAYYNHWRESVYDYAFFQCRYLHNIKTEEGYFQYLSANYAEDSLYVNKVKKIIEEKDLKKLFD